MKVLIILAIVGACWASQQQQDGQPGWDIGKTYTYSVKGHALSGLRVDQHGGLQLQYKAKFTRQGQNQYYFQPKDFQVVSNCQNQCQQVPNRPIPQSLLQYLEAPVQFSMNQQGRVQSIRFDHSIPQWAMNFKKAQISAFVTNQQYPQQLSQQQSQQGQQQQSKYQQQEKTVYGECQVQYLFEGYGQQGQNYAQQQEQNDQYSQQYQQQQQQSQGKSWYSRITGGDNSDSSQEDDDSQQQGQQYQQNGQYNGKQNGQQNGQYNGQQNGQYNGQQNGQRNGQHNGQQNGQYNGQQNGQQNGQYNGQQNGQQNGQYNGQQNGQHQQNQQYNNNYNNYADDDNSNDSSAQGFFAKLGRKFGVTGSSEQQSEEYQQYQQQNQIQQQSSSEEQEQQQAARKGCDSSDQKFQFTKTYKVSDCSHTPNFSNSSSNQQERNIQRRQIQTRYYACGPNKNQYNIYRIERREATKQAQEATLQANLIDVSSASSSAQKGQIQQPSVYSNLAYNFQVQQLKRTMPIVEMDQEEYQKQLQSHAGVGQVVIFKDNDFQGSHTTLDLGRNKCFGLPSGWNDVISSIDPQLSCIILWEHRGCTGQAIRLERYSYGSAHLDRVLMDDKTSSIQLC